jgi:hypothetical protein
VRGPNQSEENDEDNNNTTAVTSYPSIADAEYICVTTDCEEHWQCRRIRWFSEFRGWPLTDVVVDGSWSVKVG